MDEFHLRVHLVRSRSIHYVFRYTVFQLPHGHMVECFSFGVHTVCGGAVVEFSLGGRMRRMPGGNDEWRWRRRMHVVRVLAVLGCKSRPNALSRAPSAANKAQAVVIFPTCYGSALRANSRMTPA